MNGIAFGVVGLVLGAVLVLSVRRIVGSGLPPRHFPGGPQVTIHLVPGTGQITVTPEHVAVASRNSSGSVPDKGRLKWRVTGPPNHSALVEFDSGQGPFPRDPANPKNPQRGTYRLNVTDVLTTEEEDVTDESDPCTFAWKYTITHFDAAGNQVGDPLDPMVVLGKEI